MKKIVHTDKAPEAIGPYSQAVIDPNSGLVFTAGQIAIDPSTGEIVSGDVADQARQVFENLQNVLQAAGIDFGNVLKATVFLKNMDDFTRVNEVYSQYFKRDFPARSAVEVARLPRDVLLEIEMIAHV
ncbi:MAG: RidA family protein [candidate division Zixibacteria bacterium]